MLGRQQFSTADVLAHHFKKSSFKQKIMGSVETHGRTHAPGSGRQLASVLVKVDRGSAALHPAPCVRFPQRRGVLEAHRDGLGRPGMIFWTATGGGIAKPHETVDACSQIEPPKSTKKKHKNAGHAQSQC